MIPPVEITDLRGTRAERGAGGWELHEASSWLVHIDGPPCAVRLGARDLTWDQRIPGVRLDLTYAVGSLELHIERAREQRTERLQVVPAAHKVAPATWERLLAELELWLPSLTTGAEGPRLGSVGSEGVAAPLLIEALLPLVPQLMAAVEALLAEPRRLATDQLEFVALHRLGAATDEPLRWLASHPADAAWLRGASGGEPPTLPQRRIHDTLDHPANRYLAWLMRRLLRRFDEVVRALDAVPANELNDTRLWLVARAGALRSARGRLDKLLRRSFLGRLEPGPPSEGAMLVVTDHPRYARVHRLARRLLAPRFKLTEGELAAATRPSFHLYELWCLLALQRAVDVVAPGGPLRWTARGLDRLLALRGTGAGAALRGVGGDLEVDLLFNPSFPSGAGQPTVVGRRSLSGERRPDLVLRVARPGHRAWCVFDAKYRVGARSLGEALGSAHIYRDALRWDAWGGRCSGAWLLAPRRTDDAGLWFDAAFHGEHGFGVVELRPGRGVSVELRGLLAGLLDHERPEPT